MTKTKLTRTVYRYRGMDGLFVKFALTVAVALVSTFIAHLDSALKLWRLYTGLTIHEDYKSSISDAGLWRMALSRLWTRIRDVTPLERATIALALLFFVILALLFASIWSSRLRLFLFYDCCYFREGTAEFRNFVVSKSTHVFVQELTSFEDSAFLERRGLGDSLIELRRSHFFLSYLHDHKKFVFDEKSCKFEPVEHIDELDLSTLSEWTGLSAKCGSSNLRCGLERSLSVCKDLYGANDYEIPVCNFWKMIFDAVLAPFFLFQIFSTLMWILDNYWYCSLLSVVSMITIEVQMVRKRIAEYDRINSMRLPPGVVSVYRDSKWTLVSSVDIYPGDLITLSGDDADIPTVVSADCLILSGEVVVDESILTGESVPQFKAAIELGAGLRGEAANLRQSTLFAGTSILLCRGGAGAWRGPKRPKFGCVCLVLRTGFESYQGRLVNAIMHSGDRVSASTVEGWCFLAIMLSFALVSCAIVVKNSPSNSLRKLVLVSLHIITSVIPPEFPLVLSMSVTIAIIQLYRKGVFCTEPFRVPFAGSLDICAFDKTGTLTDNSMRVFGVVRENVQSLESVQAEQFLPISTSIVVGGCNSLSTIKGAVVGDPMEKSSFEYFGWSLLSDGNTVESFEPFFLDSRGGMANAKIKILRRWPFTAESGRMMTIASVSGKASRWAKVGAIESLESSESLDKNEIFDGKMVLLCKGAPEQLRGILREVPSFYDSLQQKLAIRGLRVLTLAYKKLDESVNYSVVQRSVIEHSLEFAGFLALEAPIKPSCLSCMRQLKGHKLVMITGDNVLTACHVANSVEITDRSHFVDSTLRDSRRENSRSGGKEEENLEFAILTFSSERFSWRRRTGELISDIEFDKNIEGLKRSYRLCLTGPALDALMERYKSADIDIVGRVVESSTVFARMSPQQKEFVIRTFRKAGKTVAMCGDGTNDMAALKAAQVGISLLNSAIKQAKRSNFGKVRLLGLERSRLYSKQEAMAQLKRELEEEVPQLKLGEASIASPFTYRGSDVLCVPLLVRSGRCSLANVIMLYKLMGINSLITSMGMSILALDGVNFSDAQTTLYSLLYTYFVVSLSRSRPAEASSAKKPEASVFSPSNFLSLLLQLVLHGWSLLYVWGLGKAHRDPGYVGNLDAPFEPNIVNTLVYYVCFSINLSSFVANYHGYPYMQPLSENSFFYRPLVASYLLLCAFVFDCAGPLSGFFSLVKISCNKLRIKTAAVLAFDCISSVAIARTVRRIFGQ